MKICSTCKKEKAFSEFNKNKAKKDGLNTICRLCSNKRSKLYYIQNTEKHKESVFQQKKRQRELLKDFVKSLKMGGCSNCDENDPSCMDFHHLDSETKDHNIANMILKGYSMKSLKREINKCVILCANCHRKVHAGVLEI